MLKHRPLTWEIDVKAKHCPGNEWSICTAWSDQGKQKVSDCFPAGFPAI